MNEPNKELPYPGCIVELKHKGSRHFGELLGVHKARPNSDILIIDAGLPIPWAVPEGSVERYHHQGATLTFIGEGGAE